MQILLRDAVRHPWPLNENIHVFDTLCRIYTGLLTFFDLTSFDTVNEVLADILLSAHLLNVFEGRTFIAT
ncbi:hypothetical protein [Shewanella colwelliana]|uniref:hypothetical protein n=1 Tax=Shewanella colwelliana TaxID=23 RepID=UPI0012DC5870|nr:hypothetical protein [Shewanella colwelliana]